MRRTLWYGLAGALGVAVVVYLGLASGLLVPYLGVGYDPPEDPEYEQTTVTALDGESGEELGRVEAAVADSALKRFVGLGETDALPPDQGMLFVHADAAERTYVMRGMSFGIDIVYVAPNGTITTVHEAPAPGPNEDGTEQRYRGNGQYVLEVERGWTADHGVAEGDRIEFEL